MEAKKIDVDQVDWRVLAILLVDEGRTPVVQAKDLVCRHVDGSIGIRTQFGGQLLEMVDVGKVLEGAPHSVRVCALQTIRVMRAIGFEKEIVDENRKDNRSLFMASDITLTQMHVTLANCQRQLEIAIKHSGISIYTFELTEG